MAGEFLTEAQVRSYGHFAGVPSRSDLERFFLLDDADRPSTPEGAPGRKVGMLVPGRRVEGWTQTRSSAVNAQRAVEGTHAPPPVRERGR